MRSPLYGNPLVRRELVRLRRRFWLWGLLLLAVFIPLSYLTREVQFGAFQTMAMPAQIALYSLSTFLRADVIIAFFLCYRVAHSEEWLQHRDELGVTLLTPLQIVAGKAFVPVLLVFALNAGGAWFFYSDLVSDPANEIIVLGESLIEPVPEQRSIYGNLPPAFFQGGAATTQTLTLVQALQPADQSPTEVTGMRINAGLPVMLFGFLEDLFFCALVVMLGLRQYMLRHHALMATFTALGWLMLIGAGIALCSWLSHFLWFLLPDGMIDMLVYSQGLQMLYDNSFWFATVLPYELLLTLVIGRSLVRKIPGLLREESEAPEAEES